MSAPLIFTYLNAMADKNASDLYLTVDFPPTLRGDQGFSSIGSEVLTPDAIQQILNDVLTSRQKRDFESERELNTSLSMGKHGRFRINVLMQRQNPALVIRRVVSKIPSFEELSLPPVIRDLSMEKRGLILLTGMTGAGKSTTLASMIDHRNASREGHIITIEDPIEYFHEHQKCVVTQREIGVDTESYAIALKNALRQRPDVILVGEIRDREVMEQALTAAETGHLCLATIHTNNTYQSIERIVNMFPDEYAGQVRLSLSINLKAIISQRLLPTTEGSFVPALEIMLNQGLVKELIQKGRITKIKDVMEKNRALGMCSFEQHISELYNKGVISEDTALTNVDHVSDMKITLDKMKLAAESKGNPNPIKGVDTSIFSLKD